MVNILTHLQIEIAQLTVRHFVDSSDTLLIQVEKKALLAFNKCF